MAYKTVMCPIVVPVGAYCCGPVISFGDQPECEYLDPELDPYCHIFDKHPKRTKADRFLKLAACKRLQLQVLPIKRVRKKIKQKQSVRRKIRI